MAEILTFTLWAPMAAMGDIAVGERRVGHTRPARSAILGLVAASLGIERDDAATLAAIEAGYGVALLVERAGDLLQDYHSVQLPKPGRHRRKATRRDELAEPGRLNTILTWREHRAEPWITVALWARETAPRPLQDLAKALERPRFTLYFGRKACPLGLPPAALLDDEAASLADAFDRREGKRSLEERRLRHALGIRDATGTLHADTDAERPDGPGLGRAVARVERRRDIALNRRRWQFGLRDELVASQAGATP